MSDSVDTPGVAALKELLRQLPPQLIASAKASLDAGYVPFSMTMNRTHVSGKIPGLYSKSRCLNALMSGPVTCALLEGASDREDVMSGPYNQVAGICSMIFGMPLYEAEPRFLCQMAIRHAIRGVYSEIYS